MDISSLPVVSGGFPSPADSFFERQLNTQDLLVPHPDWTYFSTVDGDSMSGAGIHSGDVLIIDRSLDAVQHSVIVAALNGSFVVKRIQYRDEQIVLLSEHHRYPPLIVDPKRDAFSIFGVVTWCLHRIDQHARGPVVPSSSRVSPALPPSRHPRR